MFYNSITKSFWNSDPPMSNKIVTDEKFERRRKLPDDIHAVTYKDTIEAGKSIVCYTD